MAAPPSQAEEKMVLVPQAPEQVLSAERISSPPQALPSAADSRGKVRA
jgi:hypothetical protein